MVTVQDFAVRWVHVSLINARAYGWILSRDRASESIFFPPAKRLHSQPNHSDFLLRKQVSKGPSPIWIHSLVSSTAQPWTQRRVIMQLACCFAHDWWCPKSRGGSGDEIEVRRGCLWFLCSWPSEVTLQSNLGWVRWAWRRALPCSTVSTEARAGD
jgi:hypothetical protein